MTGERFQTLPTNYREFLGVSSRELGYGKEAVTARFFEHIAENGQRLGVYETRPNGVTDQPPRRTILMPASHDYRIEPSWMRRADIIASTTDSRVVLVDMPGTTGLLEEDGEGGWRVYSSTDKLSGASQTMRQLSSALVGDFRNHADIQLETIMNTVGFTKTEEVVLLGESMGAQVVTDMLALADEFNITVSEVILYEAVNLFEGYHLNVPLHLMKVLSGVENDRRTHYIGENTKIGHPTTAFEMEITAPYQKQLDQARKTLGQQGLASAINGLGMARGVNARLKRTLERIPRRERPGVSLVRGRESMASKPEDYQALHDVLRQLGLASRMYQVSDTELKDYKPYPMGHSHLFSLARTHQVFDTLFE